MQTEGIAKTSYSGVVDALRKIAAKEGSLALYQGIGHAKSLRQPVNEPTLGQVQRWLGLCLTPA